MPIEYFIIFVFCCVADEYKRAFKKLSSLKRGFAPKLSDAEIITMAIVGECYRRR